MAARMKAVRWHARGDVRVEDVPRPVPGPDQVLIRVEAAGICGTDVEEFRNGPITVPVEPHPVSGRSAPVTIGHEVVGIVAQAGEASSIAVGTRVAPWPITPCQQCADCLGGHTNRCRRMVALGMSEDGGMADYVLAAASRCVVVGPDVALERAVLVEPYAVALHGLHQVDVRGARVAVIGLGSLGLCVVDGAVRQGADVVAISRSPAARELALRFGARSTLALEQARDANVDIVFETAGARPAIEASAQAVERGGRVVVLGGHPGRTSLDLLDLTVREITILGAVSHCFERDFAGAANLITSGGLASHPRPTQVGRLDDGPDWLRESTGITKRVLVPSQA
ncbi:MAG TPA: alcohol dehydrogenase catalytic domain-containing protein [Candidatus Limnocylindrales bacterium]